MTKIAERRASGVKEYLIRVRIEPSKFSSLTINDSRRADVPKDADGLAVDGPLTIRPFGEDVSIRIGYAPGAYDLFHVGHLNLLRHAKSRCDFLIAGVVSDEMLELAKGRHPVIPLDERLAIVSHISYVDRAIAEVVPDKLETWESVRFNVLFKGDDWRGTAKGEKLERDFAAVGVKIVYFPYTMHTSSSMLRRVLSGVAGEREPIEATG